jgi:hypothetical protein
MNPKLKSKIGIATALSVSFLLALTLFSPLARSHAYGAANFKATFAGTFTLPGSGNNGFWGWCDFGGGTGSPATSGTDADCKISQYFGPSHSFQVVESVQGTAWGVGPCTIQPCLPLTSSTPTDFYITAGTVTFAGPFAVQLTSSGPPPPGSGCTVSGTTATCPIAFLEAVGFYTPDTGITTVPGHYNLNAFIPLAFSGAVGEFQEQVVQVG